MQYYHNPNSISENATAVACGKFDGIHKGHRALLSELKNLKKQGLTSAVFTFDASISKIIPNYSEFIYTGEERRYILEQMGIEVLAEYSFDKSLASLAPEEFIKNILKDRMNAKAVVVGEDFRFGYKRQGDVDLLIQCQKKYGYNLTVVEKQVDEQGKISSSRIREYIKQGNIKRAEEMLESPYFVRGEVVHGKQLGRTMGMPTVNLKVDKHKLLPPNGVYVSRNHLQNEVYYGITNIGVRPTVDGEALGVETHLFDFEREIYGEVISTELLAFERFEKRFSSLEQLQKQMEKDVEFGRRYVESL